MELNDRFGAPQSNGIGDTPWMPALLATFSVFANRFVVSALLPVEVEPQRCGSTRPS